MSLRVLLGITLFSATASPQPCVSLQPASLPVNILETCRPKPVTPQERQIVLGSLPSKGDVRQFNSVQKKKLAALEAVLRVHNRDNIYEVKVIQLPQATTALHDRTVLLVTLPALTILSATELQALAAHEIGHEYVWQEFDRAKERGDKTKLRELELICDWVAAATLESIGVSPQHLANGLDKLHRYNRDRFGVALNEEQYPALSDRRALVKRFGSSGRSMLTATAKP